MTAWVPHVEKSAVRAWRKCYGISFVAVQELATGWLSGSEAASSGRFEGVIFSARLLIRKECWVRINQRSRRKALSDGRMTMQWTAPVFEEVCLNCEINSYVSAKL